MFILAKNPAIEQLTKSCKDRRINLSDLDPVVVDGTKCCRWCMAKLSGRKYAWCSDECSSMAWAWANPQKEGGLHILMARQDFKCAKCAYDYMPYVEDTIKYLNKNASSTRMFTVHPDKIKEKISERLMKILKYKVPTDRRPEVDHIVPISKGGQSIGFDNHQAICYCCHKAKTKVDLSGKRKKKE